MGDVKDDTYAEDSIQPVSSLRSHFEQISVADAEKKKRSTEKPRHHGSSPLRNPHVPVSNSISHIVRGDGIEDSGDFYSNIARPASASLPAKRSFVRTASDMNSVIPAPGVLHLEEKRNGSAISCANPSSEAATHFLAPAHAIVSRRQPALPNPVSRIESDQSRRTDNVAPPPINRSIKPRTGPRPGTSNVSHELRPPSPSLNEGASPFTTPPSSDESSTSTSKAISRVDSKSQKPKSAKGSFMKNARVTASSAEPARYQPNPPNLPPRIPGGSSFPVRTPEDVKASGLDVKSQISPKPPSVSVGYNNLIQHIQGRPPPKVTQASFQPQYPTASTAQNITQQTEALATSLKDATFPTISSINRKLPYCQTGARTVDVGDEVRQADLCGKYVCTLGHAVKVWNVLTGEMLCSIAQTDRDIKATALAFKPAATSDDEGSRLWLGTNSGDLQEIEVAKQTVHHGRSGAHERREITKIHRYQNAMWTIDDSGQLCVWPGDDSGLPSLRGKYHLHRVQKGHSCSLVIQGSLWLATGHDVWIYRPTTEDSTAFSVLSKPLSQPQCGTITCGTVVANQWDLAFFGHTDGKISVFSTSSLECVALVSVNIYKVTAIVGAGSFLWTAFSVGTMSVFDTSTSPWNTKKTWIGHQGQPIHGLAVDRSGLWKHGALRILSYGSENLLRFWDGTLSHDWMASFMSDREPDYCSFSEVSTLVVSWNAGATTPSQLRHKICDTEFFADLVKRSNFPDIVAFGFQELVDLEDKKLTAKSLFKGNKKRDTVEYEHISHQYRAWRDYLGKSMEDTGRPTDSYRLIHTANMVGLFTCMFVKAALYNRIHSIRSSEVKRGMGGFHGNKGAVIVRFILDDSSFCFVNCHLAAGQTQTSARNNDITAIMESVVFPKVGEIESANESFVNGGDGSMIHDYEICFLNGDLNYRIDTMGRDAVIKAVKSNSLVKLLERDQLRVAQRRNPVFPLRSLQEAPIAFAPTYKYDIGSASYDSSEKRRSPAWCDRILHKRSSRIRQLNYLRHELQISDHRPVSALFTASVKQISTSKRVATQAQAAELFNAEMESFSNQTKLAYLRDVLGVPLGEGRQLVRQ